MLEDMKIEICKLYNNADSPVLFFIDDFANVWVDTNDNGKVDLGEDWGYAKDGENSSFKYLNKVILKDFSSVKTTFFVPVGLRVGMIEEPKIKSISKMINCDEKTKKFFKSINDNPRYEIAYHGTTHGKVGKTRDDFKQEWELFKSLEEAVETINKGKEVYKDVFGEYPRGGKYPGYETNEFSDDSIDKTGFFWWSRYWNRAIIDDPTCSTSGQDLNPLTNCDIKTFGNSKVIDIPSTLNGGLLTGILNPSLKSIKGIAKKILKLYLIKQRLKDIDYLLKNNLVISIQEHITPARDDGRRQSPNIFDDKDSLIYIFNYLKNKNVWYCTATELAEYYWRTSNIELKVINDVKFTIKFNLLKRTSNNAITLKTNMINSKLKKPDGSLVSGNKGIFNIEVQEGEYIFTE